MRAGALFAVVVTASLVGLAQAPSQNVKKPKLTIELRALDSHVRMGDGLSLSTVFRCREGSVALWNALYWSSALGLRLQVLDRNGSEVKSFAPPIDPIPPSDSGAGDLVSIGGSTFVGFDSQIPANILFPKPGRFLLKCIYTPPLPRGYFPRITIWGNEDGRIESPPIEILVESH